MRTVLEALFDKITNKPKKKKNSKRKFCEEFDRRESMLKEWQASGSFVKKLELKSDSMLWSKLENWNQLQITPFFAKKK